MNLYDQKVKHLKELLSKIETEFYNYKAYIEANEIKIKLKAEEVERFINSQIDTLHKTEKTLHEYETNLQNIRDGLENSIKERKQGFPWLAQAYDELQQLIDRKSYIQLKSKKNPAIKTAEILKEEKRLRRESTLKLRIAENLIKYYEHIVPSLIETREDITEDKFDIHDSEYDDALLKYLSKQEYLNLSDINRNKLALERYWKSNKSKQEIGRMYERYIGHLYELKGYTVSYQGIFGGIEDLGRDLICSNNEEIILVQCKCWANFKKIHEKHIFQFFGSVFEFQESHPSKKVKGVFTTTTSLSKLAKQFGYKLGIELIEEFKMDTNYPCIKCNISPKTSEKIYHLPIDQQYDNVIIEPEKGEFYCASIEEAEQKGFRRAYRYKTPKN